MLPDAGGLAAVATAEVVSVVVGQHRVHVTDCSTDDWLMVDALLGAGFL